MTESVVLLITGFALFLTGLLGVRFLDTVDSDAWHGDPSWTDRSSVGGGFLTASSAVIGAGFVLMVAGR